MRRRPQPGRDGLDKCGYAWPCSIMPKNATVTAAAAKTTADKMVTATAAAATAAATTVNLLPYSSCRRCYRCCLRMEDPLSISTQWRQDRSPCQQNARMASATAAAAATITTTALLQPLSVNCSCCHCCYGRPSLGTSDYDVRGVRRLRWCLCRSPPAMCGLPSFGRGCENRTAPACVKPTATIKSKKVAVAYGDETQPLHSQDDPTYHPQRHGDLRWNRCRPAQDPCRHRGEEATPM